MLGLRSALVLVLFGHLLEAKFPDFVKPCRQNKATIDKCIEDQASKVLPEFVKGVKGINVPPLVGFKLPEIHGPAYASYQLHFDGILGSLEGVKYTDSAFDLDSLLTYGTVRFPRLKLSGRYKIDGFVGNELMRGDGIATITLEEPVYNIVWFFGTEKRNGSDYLQITRSTLLSHELKRVHYDFDNLFDGNEVQEVEANDYLNRNWQILEGNFAPHVADIVHKIGLELGNRVLALAPFEEVLIP